METKICARCKKELPVSEFHRSKNSKDGYQGYCHECDREYRRMRRAETHVSIEQPSSAPSGGGTQSGLSAFSPRELLEELRRRGYKWSSLWLEKVKVEKHYVKL